MWPMQCRFIIQFSDLDGKQLCFLECSEQLESLPGTPKIGDGIGFYGPQCVDGVHGYIRYGVTYVGVATVAGKELPSVTAVAMLTVSDELLLESYIEVLSRKYLADGYKVKRLALLEGDKTSVLDITLDDDNAILVSESNPSAIQSKRDSH